MMRPERACPSTSSSSTRTSCLPIRANHSLLVSGEHTGNLAVVGVPANWNAPRTLDDDDVISISRLIPFCTPEDLEPHVHGVNIQRTTGTAYISDEGEHCFYESVTILQPSIMKL